MEIKKLSPGLVGDYLGFFDNTPHDDGTPEHKCYCVCWSSASFDGEDFSTAEKRRSAAGRYVSNGSIKGYLAYQDGKVVGWCSANLKSDCLDCQCGRMYLAPLSGPDDDRVKSVFCFVIAPEYRRRGIARALLEFVCEDAARDGFDWVEGYPLAEFNSERFDYLGPAKMFESLGFTTRLDLGDRLVVRKKLKQENE